MKTIFFIISIFLSIGFFSKNQKNIIDKFNEITKTYGMEPHSIKGIDVSHHQNNVEWEKVKKSGISFAFIKATEGAWFKDSKFNTNINQAKKNGIYVGAYHYYKPKINPYLQFENYKNSVSKEIINFPPIIDLEYLHNGELKKSEYREKFIKDIKILNKLIINHYGVKPIFYTTCDFYKNLIKNEFDNEIWICYLKNEKISFLEESQWNFRQYSFTGRINGINKNVDLNFFKGNEKDFLKKIIN